MSRSRRRTLSPSLFPFLAVLVCTLGTLILMLAIVATGATVDDAAAPADDETTRSLAQAEQLAAEAEFRLEELVAFREAQTADAEAKRNELTHLEQHTETLRQQLASINAEVESTMSTADEPDVAPELEQTRELVEARRRDLARKQQQQKQMRRRVVIVPHRGRGGTMRRPIYLECDAEGLTIWPEGVRISLETLQTSASLRDIPDANPLDAALRTARMHAMKHYGDSEPPYPMLVVRPDGIDAYAAARGAMADWDDQYGYELVDADVELAFPPEDVVLKKSLASIIEQTISRQSALQRSSLALGRGGPSGGRRQPLPSSGQTPRIISAADLTRRGGVTGFQPDNEFSIQRQNDALPQDDPLAAFLEGRSGDLDPSDRFAGSDGFASGPMDDQTSALDQRRGGTATDAIRSLHQAGQRPGDADLADRTDPQQRRPDSLTGQAAAENDASGGDAADRRQQTGDSNGSPAMASMNAAAEQSFDQNAASNTLANASMSSQQVDGGQPDPFGGTPPPPTTDLSRPDDNASRQNQQRQSQQASASGGQSDPAINRRGQQWALPQNIRHGGGNTVIRTMPIRISDRAIAIGDRTIAIDPNHPQASFDQVVLEARETMRRWGPALAGGRWQPRITADVYRGGEVRCEQLGRYLRNSGIDFVRQTPPRSANTSSTPTETR